MSTDPHDLRRVVILGGYGVFGGKLALALLRDPQFEIVVAGRRLPEAEAFCAQHGGVPALLDRSGPGFAEALADLKPFVTVDAAGPFQAYQESDYSVARAALAAGSHYLDLSDDGSFTRGIKSLDGTAKSHGKTVLSGVSSVPALSSAAVQALRKDFSRLDLIESAILPGNRAPRGLSVMRAILGQAGKPLPVFRGGGWTSVPGWSGLKRRRIGGRKSGLPPRWTSFIGAPDLLLFPDHYGARTVLFRAGLELPLMHLGLWGLSWLTRLGLIRSLEPSAKVLQMIANWLEPLGSDRGGMEVRLAGLSQDGTPQAETWTLIAEAGDGPHIPAVAAAILCRRLTDGTVAPGARACLGEFCLEDFDAATSHLSVTTYRDADRNPCLFQKALGAHFMQLPEAVRELHTVFDRRSWTGKGTVTRGQSAIGNLICRLVGFPTEADNIPVSVTIERRGDGERWRRTFGDKTFTSKMSLSGKTGQGYIYEKFGPMKFKVGLQTDGKRLSYPVIRGSLFGLPLPKWLLPVSEASEYAEGGRFNFDVKVSLPGIGRLVRYRGWLQDKGASADLPEPIRD